MSEDSDKKPEFVLDPADVKEGHMMLFFHYAKVDTVKTRPNSVEKALAVTDLDTGIHLEVHGDVLIKKAISCDVFKTTEKVSKSAAAQMLISAGKMPFTVCFVKQDEAERTLRGRLVSHESLLGRSLVEDLDVTEPNKIRLVDHRTLRWIIFNGVKYVVKS